MKKLSDAAYRLEGQRMFQILAVARELERQGKEILHFELGDPDFDTPKNIVQAAIESLRNGETHYAPSSGLLEFKKAASEVTLRSREFKPDLDSSRLMEIKQKYGLDEFVLYVSNIYKYKNFFELIHAFSLIKEQVNPGLKLALVGKSFDDQYTESLKTLVKEKKMEDCVIFFGHVSYEELPYFYMLCQLFVYPSTCENCPNILIV